MGKLRAALVLVLVMAGSAACRHSVTVVDTTPKPAQADGTISGRVTTPAGQPVTGRQVHAVNNETGARFNAVSARDGGFTMKVPPGHYHLDVTLRNGEAVVDPPADLDVGRADIDANVTLTVGPAAAGR